MPFRIVAGMIRMGRKYLIDHLSSKGVAHLTAELPRSLKEFEAKRVWTTGGGQYHRREFRFTQIVPHDDLLFDIIALAIDERVHTILPQALFLVLLKAVRLRFSHSGQLPDAFFPSQEQEDVSIGAYPQLSSQAQLMCLRGLTKFTSLHRRQVFDWVEAIAIEDDEYGEDPTEYCQTSGLCRRTMGDIKEKLWLQDLNLSMIFIEEDKLASFFRSHGWQIDVCQACYRAAVARTKELTKTMWKMLPAYFLTPEGKHGDLAWGDLKDFDG